MLSMRNEMERMLRKYCCEPKVCLTSYYLFFIAIRLMIDEFLYPHRHTATLD